MGCAVTQGEINSLLPWHFLIRGLQPLSKNVSIVIQALRLATYLRGSLGCPWKQHFSCISQWQEMHISRCCPCSHKISESGAVYCACFHGSSDTSRQVFCLGAFGRTVYTDLHCRYRQVCTWWGCLTRGPSISHACLFSADGGAFSTQNLPDDMVAFFKLLKPPIAGFEVITTHRDALSSSYSSAFCLLCCANALWSAAFRMPSLFFSMVENVLGDMA